MHDHSHYMITGGQEGADRLNILANALWPDSRQFLLRAGLKTGMHCLDIGCGNGEITSRILNELGSSGRITGLDFDPEVIRIAEERSQHNERISFRIFDIEDESLEIESYDFIFCRFLLSHLQSPEGALLKIKEALRPGGVLAVEDVDFDGHFCYPPNPAFATYVRLYQLTGIQKGVNPLIGPLLPTMLEAQGLKHIGMHVALPTFRTGDGKQLALLTMHAIQQAVIATGLATTVEVNDILRELKEYTDDPRTMMSLPRIFQVWGSL